MNKTIGSFDILQTFSTELYNVLLSSISSIVGGAEYIRRMHKEYVIRKELQSLHKNRHEFIIALCDILSEKAFIEEHSRIDEKIEKIKENPIFMKDFEKLNDLFSSLDQQDPGV